MKAIVMAGGEGARLRPLTGGRPKPMVELLGKPVLEHTVALLKKHGITDICFTLRYLPRIIEDHFGGGEDFGVKIEHRVEETPLGTAGGVRACADFAAGEDVLVLSGDAVCDFDLKKCVDFHKNTGAEATVVLYEHPEPTEYGLVITDPDGRITAFLEKPSWDRVMTNQINTGIYILSPRVLEEIPEGEPCDFGHDLFPRLLAAGRGLYGVAAEGYWCDVGTPEAYRQCCRDVLNGHVDLSIDAARLADGVWSQEPLTDVTLHPPVYVGSRCRVAPGVTLGPHTVLSDDSRVGKGAVIRDSILNGVQIGANAKIGGAVIGRGSIIADRAEINKGCVIGDGVHVGRGSVLAPGVRIWSGRNVPDGCRVTKSLIGESSDTKVGVGTDGCARGAYPSELSPETVMAYGAVLGSLGRVGVAHTGGEAARLLASALGCGITGAGGECCALDATFEAELASSCGIFFLGAAVFIRQNGPDMELTFLDGVGLPIGSALRRKLESSRDSDYPHVVGDAVGSTNHVTGTGQAYLSGLTAAVREMVRSNKRLVLAVNGGGAENRTLRRALELLGHKVTEPAKGVPTFSVPRGGFALTATDERGRVLDATQMLALTADAAMRLGTRELAIPADAPDAIKKLAKKYGCSLRPVTPEDKEAAWFYARQRYLLDGVYAAAVIVSAMAGDGVELSHLYDRIPRFAVATRRVDVACSRAKAMRLLAAGIPEMATEIASGLTMETPRGRMRITPSADGAALELRGEGENAEIARELCGDFERLARDIAKENP